MYHNHTIRPEVRNILGNTQERDCQSFKNQETPTQEKTLWGRIKVAARKVFGAIKKAVSYVRSEIVPITIAAAGLLNAWNNYQRNNRNERGAVCAA